MLRYTALLFVLPLTVSAQISPGSCATGTAEAALVGSGVEATLVNTGAFFFRDEEGGNFYEVDGASPMYWASVWVGGVVEGEPRVAAATYSRFEFWPGPLGEDGRPVDPDDCSAYDRIFAVTADDLAAYEAGTVPSADLADWPAALGAPVVDGDGVPGNYDLAAGDRPALRGESTAFWLMNDAGNEHENTGGSPLGVEVGVTAFAEGTEPTTGSASRTRAPSPSTASASASTPTPTSAGTATTTSGATRCSTSATSTTPTTSTRARPVSRAMAKRRPPSGSRC